MKKQLYVITGKANCGKTTTVKYIHSELEKLYAGRISDCHGNTRLKTEIQKSMKVNNFQVGSSSAGDDVKTIKKRLEGTVIAFSSNGDDCRIISKYLFCLKDSDIIITAARTTKNQKQLQTVLDFASKYKFNVKEYPITKEKDVPSSIVRKDVASQILNDIKSLVSTI